jgi:hypothetical protein
MTETEHESPLIAGLISVPGNELSLDDTVRRYHYVDDGSDRITLRHRRA